MIKAAIKKTLLQFTDLLFAPLNALFLFSVRIFRYYGLEFFPVFRLLIKKAGVLPVHNQYYQPQFLYRKNFEFDNARDIKVDFDLEKQFSILENFQHKGELNDGVSRFSAFDLQNGSFEEGDAELYYLILRNYKPSKIIEIGSGYSTKVASIGIEENRKEGSNSLCYAIEPFEHRWLEQLSGIKLIREKVENVDEEIFQQLTKGDILFIDSSHIIRPENDVLHIYLKILPSIPSGVIVHIHDIFTPRHYPRQWLAHEFRLWNEQYLLETILTYGDQFEVLFSLNHLFKTDFDRLKKSLPNIHQAVNPASFWMVKR